MPARKIKNMMTALQNTNVNTLTIISSNSPRDQKYTSDNFCALPPIASSSIHIHQTMHVSALNSVMDCNGRAEEKAIFGPSDQKTPESIDVKFRRIN
jgi:hypothetical protein